MESLRNTAGFLGTNASLLADITLVIQVLFYITLCLGITAQLRRHYHWHDRFQIPVVVLNLFFIAFVMIPTFSFVAGQLPGGLSQTGVLVPTIHAVLGTIAEGLAIYCLLAGLKILPRKIGVLRYWMWTTFIFWTAAILFGVGVYIVFYTGEPAGGAETIAEHDADLVEEAVGEAPPEEAPAEEVVGEHAEAPVVEAPPEEAPAEEVAGEHAEEPVELVAEATEEAVAEHVEEAVVEPTPVPTPTPTPAPVAVGRLFFSDGANHGDQANLEMSGVAPPPEGFEYEAWLEAPEAAPFSIGRLTVAGDTVNYTFVDPDGRNLLGIYSAMFISQEPLDDTDPAPVEIRPYAGAVAPAVMEQVRLAVVAAPDTPDGDGYAFNARAEVEKFFLEVGFQQDYSIAENDLAALKIQAEGVLNVLDGTNAPDYGDRDGSGDVYNPGDGAGLLGAEGYLPRIIERAQAAGQAEGATPNVVLSAGQTQTAAENALGWAEQIRELELQILGVADTAAAAELVTQVVDLTNALRDSDGAGLTDPEQGGVVAAYTYGQLMGAIEIFTQPGAQAAPELLDEHDAEDVIDEHGAEGLISEPDFTGEVVQAAWEQLAAVNAGPGPRYEHAMQYNAATNQVFLFGGRDGNQVFNDTWVLNLDDLTWRQLAIDSPVRPPARYSLVMMVDEAAENLYITTGQTENRDVLNDIWQLDLAAETWQDLSGTAGQAPEARYGSSGGNLNDNLVVTHGFGQTRYDNTWLFNTGAGQWENITPAGEVPLRRCLFAAAPGPDQLVMHGGCASGFGDCFLDDTWVLDTTAQTWRQVSSETRPVGRQYQTLVSTTDPNQIILYGGQDGSRAARSDAWLLNVAADAWRLIEAPAGPAARYNHATVWAPGSGMLIFGGRDGSAAFDDVWLLSLQS